MAQIPNDVRQNIADAADGYIQAYLEKQRDVTAKEADYAAAVVAYDTKFNQYNIPISELQTSQDNARNLYSGIPSIEEGYDARLAEFEPIIVAFLSQFQSSTIDFAELGKRLSLSGGNVVVSDI